MILGIHHVAVSVPDLDEAVRFYCDVLGFEALWGSEYAEPSENVDRAIGLTGVTADMKMLKAGNAYVELWRYHNPAPRPKDPAYPPSDHGLAHFCLQVEDIAHEHARLTAGGMTFVGPPVNFGQMSAVYGRDPFGNIIEIFEIRENAAPGLARPGRDGPGPELS